MKSFIRRSLNLTAPIINVFVYLPTLISCYWLKFVRMLGVSRLSLARKAFVGTGIYPIRDHYYEPLFNTNRLQSPLSTDRNLPGIKWRLEEQKNFCGRFTFAHELLAIQKTPRSTSSYSFDNESFGAGDSEYLYNMIRYLKPSKIIEIGSGNSTLMAIEAIKKNRSEDLQYTCEHICIEPFERPWLAKLDIKLIRELVENVDQNIFKTLGHNDILFIDSSHVIRPQGDVLCEYLEIIPNLNEGVFIHVHDIFSPKDYPDNWLRKEMKLWNEQYLLEAFLSNNPDFEIVGALNFLKYHGKEELGNCCPVFGANSGSYEPGSFWFKKVR